MGDLEKKEADYEVSLHDLKPHFLFNMLNVIKCSIVLESENAVDLIDDYAKYLRYVMKSSEGIEKVLAGEELVFLGAYARLEEARFPNIKVQFDVESTNFYVRPFILKEILHNAIHHGFTGGHSGGVVWVLIYLKEGSVTVEIRDNGEGMTKEELEDVMQSETTLQRIREELLSEGNSFEINSKKKCGTWVRMIFKEKGEKKKDENDSC